MYDPNLIYDLGMHLGEDSEYYLKKGFRVVAFEANPELVDTCKWRFVDQIKNGQLIIIEGAVAPPNYDDTITFYRHSHSVWGTIQPDFNERNLKLWGDPMGTIQVKRIDFADTLNRYGIPFFLKIDVEGLDRHVLRALEQFPIHPKHISIESEKVDFSQLESELKLLRDLGYDKFRAVQQATIPGLSINTKDLGGASLEHTFRAHASGPFGDDLQQPWESYDEVLENYRKIFKYYRWFGDQSVLRRLRVMDAVERLIRRSLQSWYDTHATGRSLTR
jgi:FkbM family methyltransferase